MYSRGKIKIYLLYKYLLIFFFQEKNLIIKFISIVNSILYYYKPNHLYLLSCIINKYMIIYFFQKGEYFLLIEKKRVFLLCHFLSIDEPNIYSELSLTFIKFFAHTQDKL